MRALSPSPSFTPRVIIAPTMRVAELFIRNSGFSPGECMVATNAFQLQGYRLESWETWFVQGMWPCRTHEDVRTMEATMAYARCRGADIRRWWT